MRGISPIAQDKWRKREVVRVVCGNLNPSDIVGKARPYRPVKLEPQPPQSFTYTLIHTIGRGMVYGGGLRGRTASKSVFRQKARHISDKHRISVEEMLGDSRCKRFVRARQELFYVLVKKHGWALSEVGRQARRDHTTIYHGVCRHAKLLAVSITPNAAGSGR